MKRLQIIFATALAALAAAGCSHDGKDAPTKDREDCVDVWFSPGQAGNLNLSQRDKTEIQIAACRADVRGSIVVPLDIKCSEKGIFFAQALRFEDGQKEATFLLSFPDAALQKEYECNIAITDPRYARVYGLNETSIDLRIRIEDNVKFATATFRSEVFTSEWSVLIDYSPILDEYRFKNVYDERTGNHISFRWGGKDSEEVTLVENPVDTGMTKGSDPILVTYESARYNKMLKRFEFSSVYTVAGSTLADGKEYYTITEEF